MSNYRRLYIPGGTYFFTLVADGRRPLLAADERVEAFRYALRYVQARRPFTVVAGVILPDHLHVLWTLPAGDADFSTRWQMVKTAFSRRVDPPTRADGSKALWQLRFYEHCIRDDEDFRCHLDYLHYNPVKHGHAQAPGNWPHSSFRHFVRRGWYDPAWGAGAPPAIAEIPCE